MLSKMFLGGSFRREAIESSFERFYAINENLFACIGRRYINRKLGKNCYPVSKASPLAIGAPKFKKTA